MFYRSWIFDYCTGDVISETYKHDVELCMLDYYRFFPVCTEYHNEVDMAVGVVRAVMCEKQFCMLKISILKRHT